MHAFVLWLFSFTKKNKKHNRNDKMCSFEIKEIATANLLSDHLVQEFNKTSSLEMNIRRLSC